MRVLLFTCYPKNAGKQNANLIGISLLADEGDEPLEPCQQWEEILTSAHPEELSEEKSIAFEKHLEECPKCAEVRRRDRVLHNLIRKLPFRDPQIFEETAELPEKLRRMLEFTTDPEGVLERLPEQETGNEGTSAEDTLDKQLSLADTTSQYPRSKRRNKKLSLWFTLLMDAWHVVVSLLRGREGRKF